MQAGPDGMRPPGHGVPIMVMTLNLTRRPRTKNSGQLLSLEGLTGRGEGRELHLEIRFIGPRI